MAVLPNSANADASCPLIAHIPQAPMLSQRFSPVVVPTMQKKGIPGVTSRYVIALEQNR
jgi:hypothetical protein